MKKCKGVCRVLGHVCEFWKKTRSTMHKTVSKIVGIDVSKFNIRATRFNRYRPTTQ